MKLKVPYYSQFIDITDPYWMPRACSPIAFYMAFKFLNKLPEGMMPMDLLKKVNNEGGYYTNGWRQDAFIQTAKEFGLTKAHREEGMDFKKGLLKIKENLDAGFPVGFSIVKYILEQTKFHLVLVIGYELNEDGTLKGLYYHDPESTDRDKGANHFAEIKDIEKGWRKMAVFFN